MWSAFINDISLESIAYICALTNIANGMIALITQKATDIASFMAVINMQAVGPVVSSINGGLKANSTDSVLFNQHLVVVEDRYSVIHLQVSRSLIGGAVRFFMLIQCIGLILYNAIVGYSVAFRRTLIASSDVQPHASEVKHFAAVFTRVENPSSRPFMLRVVVLGWLTFSLGSPFLVIGQAALFTDMVAGHISCFYGECGEFLNGLACRANMFSGIDLRYFSAFSKVALKCSLGYRLMAETTGRVFIVHGYAQYIKMLSICKQFLAVKFIGKVEPELALSY